MKSNNSFFLFDAARVTQEELNKTLELSENKLSLYRGNSELNLARVSPYIFNFPCYEEASAFVLEYGWGNAWGVLLLSASTLEEVYKHFRKFLLVKTEEGKELYFRFYDPRVLRIFLPTCDAQQLEEFFGPVEQFICEDEDPVFGLVFSLQGNNLISKRILKEELFGLSVQ